MTISALNEDQFEYDVAFSFLGQDEAIAVQLNDLLSDRLRTFIYSERQLELAGTDGEETFAKVFGEQARCVVVFYREAWGSTPWTRVEERAIRNRGYNEGYDFALFVSLDGKKPRWLEQNRLWIGYERWGAQSAAAVIEARATERGSSIRTETVEDRAKRLQRELDARRQRAEFHRSDIGVQKFRDESEIVKSAVERRISDLKPALSIPLVASRDNRALLISRGLAGLRVMDEVGYANNLDDWRLRVEVTQGSPPSSRVFFPPVNEPLSPLVTLKYELIGGDSLGVRWLDVGARDPVPQSSEKVAERAVLLLLDHIDKLAHDKRS